MGNDISKQKQRLLYLQGLNQYVFHGSGIKLDKLEPRQAYTIINDQSVKDGNPAVFATPIADVAIFMAIINKENIRDFRSEFIPNNGDPIFLATKKTLNRINNSLKGYIYVFDMKNFKLQGTCEAVSFKSVIPLETIMVSIKDLPNKISVID